jgi:hypothetical protein
MKHEGQFFCSSKSHIHASHTESSSVDGCGRRKLCILPFQLLWPTSAALKVITLTAKVNASVKSGVVRQCNCGQLQSTHCRIYMMASDKNLFSVVPPKISGILAGALAVVAFCSLLIICILADIVTRTFCSGMIQRQQALLVSTSISCLHVGKVCEQISRCSSPRAAAKNECLLTCLEQ